MLQTEQRFVPFPGQPGYREEPESDYGRVGGEDLTHVPWRLARVDDRDALVAGEAGVLEASLGSIVEITVPTVSSLPLQTRSPELFRSLGSPCVDWIRRLSPVSLRRK